MNKLDDYLYNTLQSDKLRTKPSDEIVTHLRNQMLVQSATRRIRQNGFLPLLSYLWERKYRTLKMGVAALLVVSFLGIKQINRPVNYLQMADSTSMNRAIDSLSLQLVDSNFTY